MPIFVHSVFQRISACVVREATRIQYNGLGIESEVAVIRFLLCSAQKEIFSAFSLSV